MKSWPELNGSWTPPDTRDNVVDFINDLGERTEVPTHSAVTGQGGRDVKRAQYAWMLPHFLGTE